MGKDFGVRSRRLTTGQRVVLALAALVALAFPTWLIGSRLAKDRAEHIARAEAWRIHGAPCPELTKAEFEGRGLKAPKGVSYEGVVFFRQFGHMACAPLRDQGGVGWRTYVACQFTSPNALKVVTAKGEWRFAPGLGQPATVTTANGVARCVLDSRFRLH